MKENTESRKNKAEKTPAESPKSQEPGRDQQEHDEEKIIQKSEPVQGQQAPKKDKSLLSREGAEDEVITHIDETEETRKIIADLTEGSNRDLEQWMQMFTELTGLDDEQRKTETHGIRRAA